MPVQPSSNSPNGVPSYVVDLQEYSGTSQPEAQAFLNGRRVSDTSSTEDYISMRNISDSPPTYYADHIQNQNGIGISITSEPPPAYSLLFDEAPPPYSPRPDGVPPPYSSLQNQSCWKSIWNNRVVTIISCTAAIFTAAGIAAPLAYYFTATDSSDNSSLDNIADTTITPTQDSFIGCDSIFPHNSAKSQQSLKQPNSYKLSKENARTLANMKILEDHFPVSENSNFVKHNKEALKNYEIEKQSINEEFFKSTALINSIAKSFPLIKHGTIKQWGFIESLSKEIDSLITKPMNARKETALNTAHSDFFSEKAQEYFDLFYNSIIDQQMQNGSDLPSQNDILKCEIKGYLDSTNINNMNFDDVAQLKQAADIFLQGCSKIINTLLVTAKKIDVNYDSRYHALANIRFQKVIYPLVSAMVATHKLHENSIKVAEYNLKLLKNENLLSLLELTTDNLPSKERQEKNKLKADILQLKEDIKVYRENIQNYREFIEKFDFRKGYNANKGFFSFNHELQKLLSLDPKTGRVTKKEKLRSIVRYIEWGYKNHHPFVLENENTYLELYSAEERAIYYEGKLRYIAKNFSRAFLENKIINDIYSKLERLFFRYHLK